MTVGTSWIFEAKLLCRSESCSVRPVQLGGKPSEATIAVIVCLVLPFFITILGYRPNTQQSRAHALTAPHKSGTRSVSSAPPTRFYQTEKAKILAADGWRIWPILWQARRRAFSVMSAFGSGDRRRSRRPWKRWHTSWRKFDPKKEGRVSPQAAGAAPEAEAEPTEASEAGRAPEQLEAGAPKKRKGPPGSIEASKHA